MNNNKLSLLSSINTPLGFFVLALLIVETFLATILVASNLSIEIKMYGMWSGIGMFFFVVILVSLFVWFKPHNLMYDQYGHLLDTGKVPFGSNNQPISSSMLDSLPQQQEET